MSTAAEFAREVEVLVLDLDGVLSNGLLIYSSNGEEMKTFHPADGLGIKLLQAQGIQVAIITGRKSNIVERRAAELGIDHVIQGCEDKLQALNTLLTKLGLSLPGVAYMGDDLPDVAAIRQAGLGMAPADADPWVIKQAQWVSDRCGGRGAVRDACEFILDSRGLLDDIRQKFAKGAGL
jgi:3-deoxy-D-manno-octulosonate 8-phosphate phosphatase (KDO 8-P phosphatase)